MSASPYIRQRVRQQRAPWLSLAAIHTLGVCLVVVASSGALYKFGVASLAWAAIYALTVAALVRDFEVVGDALLRAWPLLLFPLVCLISLFWSIEPGDTARHAAQYLFTTALAFWIGARITPQRLYVCIAAALLVCIFASALGTWLGVVPGIKQGSYVGAERYLVGLYTQKNVFGMAIVYATLALHITGRYRGQSFRYALLALALLPVLWQTKSTTGLLLYVMTWTYFPALRLGTVKRDGTPFVLAGLVGILSGALILIAADIHLLNDALAALGKDATLTGRTVIWERAVDIGMQHPVLGIGYQAFWESSRHASDVMLIRAAVLESIGGFHNGYLEVLVATGFVGVAAYALLLMSALAYTFRVALANWQPLQVGGAYFALLICSRTFTESSVYYQHDLDFILLVAIAVASLKASTAREPDAHHD